MRRTLPLLVPALLALTASVLPAAAQGRIDIRDRRAHRVVPRSVLIVRVLESVILRRAVGVAWPVWDLLLCAFGLTAAAGAFGLQQFERRPRS